MASQFNATHVNVPYDPAIAGLLSSPARRLNIFYPPAVTAVAKPVLLVVKYTGSTSARDTQYSSITEIPWRLLNSGQFVVVSISVSVPNELEAGGNIWHPPELAINGPQDQASANWGRVDRDMAIKDVAYAIDWLKRPNNMLLYGLNGAVIAYGDGPAAWAVLMNAFGPAWGTLGKASFAAGMKTRPDAIIVTKPHGVFLQSVAGSVAANSLPDVLDAGVAAATMEDTFSAYLPQLSALTVGSNESLFPGIRKKNASIPILAYSDREVAEGVPAITAVDFTLGVDASGATVQPIAPVLSQLAFQDDGYNTALLSAYAAYLDALYTGGFHNVNSKFFAKVGKTRNWGSVRYQTVSDDTALATEVLNWSLNLIQQPDLDLTDEPIPDTTPPGVPQGLVATGGTAKITLDWTDNQESDLAGYRVYRGTVSGGPYTLITPALVTSSAYVDTTPVVGTIYYYVVRAEDDAANQSANSSQVVGVASALGSSADTTAPPVPTGLAATAQNGAVSLTWNPVVATDLRGYFVSRATVSGGPYTALFGVALTQNSYVDTTAINGTTYYYVVSSIDIALNESADSAQVSATPAAPVTPPVCNTPCVLANDGSSVPPVFLDTYNDCNVGAPVAGLRARCYTISGDLLTTVTFGTYTPAAAPDQWGSEIIETQDVLGARYEIVNLPVKNSTLVPDGFLRVVWDVSDPCFEENVLVERTYVFPVDTTKCVILSWPAVTGANLYSVTSSIGGIIGYTRHTVFLDTVAKRTSVKLLGTNNTVWELFVLDSQGTRVVKQSTAAIEDVDELVLEAPGGGLWSVRVNPVGPTLVTTSIATGSPSSVVLGNSHGMFSISVQDNGTLVSSPLGSGIVTGMLGSYSVSAYSTTQTPNSNGNLAVLSTVATEDLEIIRTTRKMCLITGRLADVFGVGRPHTKLNVFTHYQDIASPVQATWMSAYGERSIDVAPDGSFAFPAMQGSVVTLEFPASGVAYKAVVPSTLQVDFSQLETLPIELRRGE